MADVFISYKSERRKAAAHLADILKLYGYTVWYDYHLFVGKDYPEQIQAELDAARAVIVLWCSMSVKSRWVLRESHVAMKAGKLMPVWIEDAEPPVPFNNAEGVMLQEWDASPRGHHLDRLLRQIGSRLNKSPVPNFEGLANFDEMWRRYGARRLADFALSTKATRPTPPAAISYKLKKIESNIIHPIKIGKNELHVENKISPSI